MELIQSNKGGQKLCRNGYIYTKKSRSNSSTFWCCVKRTIGCKATLRTTVEITHPIESKEHNHAPDNNEISVAKARTVMKLQAQKPVTNPVLYTPIMLPILRKLRCRVFLQLKPVRRR